MSCYDNLKQILKELKDMAVTAKEYENGTLEDFLFAEVCKDDIVNKLLELEIK